jgi:hypothetical protein
MDDKIYKFTCEKQDFFTSAQTQFDAETNWDFVMACEFEDCEYDVKEVKGTRF